MNKLVKKLKNRKVQLALVTIIAAAVGIWLIYARLNQVMPQSAIFFLNDVTLPAANQKVLIFSPHPDDETLGVGGYIYESTQAKAQVRIVLVTDGNKQGLKNRRYQEFKTATGILGVPQQNLVFLNYPDSKLNKVDPNQLSQTLKSQIDSFKPDFVIYPDPKDQHPDHADTGRVVQQILKSEPKTIVSYQYLIHHDLFPQPIDYAPNQYLLPPTSMVSFDKEWQRLMLTSQAEKKKEQAVRAYSSQLRNPFLRELLFSLIRRNELFLVGGANG